MRLEGERVFLRPLDERDADAVVRWRADPAVARQMFSERPPTRAEHDQWLARMHASGQRLELAIVLRAGGTTVGTIGLNGLAPGAREAEYGIMLGDAAVRGRGIGRESSALLLDHAFGALGLDAVRLELFADNEPARRLYERLGFVELPEARAERQKDGAARATLVMRITRDAWRATLR